MAVVIDFLFLLQIKGYFKAAIKYLSGTIRKKHFELHKNFLTVFTVLANYDVKSNSSMQCFKSGLIGVVAKWKS